MVLLLRLGPSQPLPEKPQELLPIVAAWRRWLTALGPNTHPSHPMTPPTQITFRHMDVSPAAEARIRDEVQALAHCHDRITSCRVVVEAPHHHQRRDETFHLSIDLHVPGSQIEVNNDKGNAAHSDVYVAIRDAFAAARRQLQDHVRIQRGEVKHHTEMPRVC